MKRILFLFVTATIIMISGCKKEDDVNLFISSADLEFDYDEDGADVSLSCIGDKEFTWNISSASDFLEFSKTTGSCSKNAPDNFTVTILRQLINRDSVRTSFNISASTGESETVSVFIYAFPEKKTRVNKTVRDVEYDYNHDRLVMLVYNSSSYKCSIELFDPDEKTFQSIPLTTQADYMSVSPDGSYLITGSGSGYYSLEYIDLINKTIENSFYVKSNSNGILAGPDKIAYLIHYSYDIATLDLTNGAYLTFDLGVNTNIEAAVLHPSGKYVYGTYYSELVKISVAGSQPYHIYTNYISDLDGNMWFSKDGLKIFTKGTSVLTIDPDLQGDDIIDQEDFPLDQNYIYGFEHNQKYNEYYIIPSDDNYSGSYTGDRLLVFDNNYQLKYTLTPEYFYSKSYFEPGYEVTDGRFRYVFACSGGEKIIAVTIPYDSYYISNTWGIEVFEREE